MLPIGALPVRDEPGELLSVRPKPAERKAITERVMSNIDPVVSHNDVEQVSSDHEVNSDDDVDDEDDDDDDDDDNDDDADDIGVIVETEVHNVVENEPQGNTTTTVAESDNETVESNVSDEVRLPTPVPAPRRSTRQKRKPQWLNSGEYELLHVMAQTHNTLNQMIIDKLTQA